MNGPSDQLFETLVELRNVELSTMWTRFNIHLVVNGGFLIAFITADDTALVRSVGPAPYIFGLILALLWLFAELAGRQALHYRDDKIGEFETKFWKNGRLEEYKVFREIPWKLRAQSWVSILFIALFFFAWIFLWYLSCFLTCG